MQHRLTANSHHGHYKMDKIYFNPGMDMQKIRLFFRLECWQT